MYLGYFFILIFVKFYIMCGYEYRDFFLTFNCYKVIFYIAKNEVKGMKFDHSLKPSNSQKPLNIPVLLDLPCTAIFISKSSK